MMESEWQSAQRGNIAKGRSEVLLKARRFG
jgi:hypothetical protein